MRHQPIHQPFPSKHKTLTNVGLMLCQHRRRWPNNKPALGQSLVFAWIKVKKVDQILDNAWRRLPGTGAMFVWRSQPIYLSVMLRKWVGGGGLKEAYQLCCCVHNDIKIPSNNFTNTGQKGIDRGALTERMTASPVTHASRVRNPLILRRFFTEISLFLPSQND